MKRLLILMGVVGALAVGVVAVAVAGAQEDSPTPSAGADEEPEREKRGDRFLDGLAENLGVSREDLDAAIDATQVELIDQAVTDGRISEERAEELKERIANGEPVFPRFGFGHGPGGDHRPWLRPLHWILENSAELLGIEKDELMEQLKDGKSLSEIATEQDIDLDDFKADLLAGAKEDLQAKVDSGDITQERADNTYEMFSENIDRVVEASHDFEMRIDGEGLRERFRACIRGGEDGGDACREGAFGEAFPFGGEFPPEAIGVAPFPGLEEFFPQTALEPADTDA